MELADVLTVAGVAASAAVITGLIQLLKATPLPTDGNEKLYALVLSAVLVVVAVLNSGVYSLESFFVAFLAWLSIAKLSTGIYDEVTRNEGAFTEKEPDTDNPPL